MTLLLRSINLQASIWLRLVLSTIWRISLTENSLPSDSSLSLAWRRARTFFSQKFCSSLAKSKGKRARCYSIYVPTSAFSTMTGVVFKHRAYSSSYIPPLPHSEESEPSKTAESYAEIILLVSLVEFLSSSFYSFARLDLSD